MFRMTQPTEADTIKLAQIIRIKQRSISILINGILVYVG